MHVRFISSLLNFFILKVLLISTPHFPFPLSTFHFINHFPNTRTEITRELLRVNLKLSIRIRHYKLFPTDAHLFLFPAFNVISKFSCCHQAVSCSFSRLHNHYHTHFDRKRTTNRIELALQLHCRPNKLFAKPKLWPFVCSNTAPTRSG